MSEDKKAALRGHSVRLDRNTYQAIIDIKEDGEKPADFVARVVAAARGSAKRGAKASPFTGIGYLDLTGGQGAGDE